MSKVIKLYDSFMAIIGSPKSYTDDNKIQEAEQLLQEFHKQWIYSSNVLGIKQSVGAKYHYLWHALE